MIAVATVNDWGAAQVAEEALDAAGIPVELKRLGMNPYFGAITTERIEVRVPPEQLAEAEGVLAHLADEVAAPLAAEWSTLRPPPALDRTGRLRAPRWLAKLLAKLGFPTENRPETQEKDHGADA